MSCDDVLKDRMVKLISILSGDTTISLHLQFLIRSNKTDYLILKNTKVNFHSHSKTANIVCKHLISC